MNKKIFWVILVFFLIINSWFANFVIQKKSIIEAANSLASKWIINNHSDNPDKYNLNDNVLRQEIAAIARGVAWLDKKTKCDNIFSDLSATKPNTWACLNVEPLVEKKLISKNKNFRPEDKITKSEAIAMLIKAIWFDYNYNTKSSKNWQEQIVEYASNKWLVDNFTDYNTQATRWWIFIVADTTIKKEKEIKKETKKLEEKQKYSDEVLYEIENILWIFQ